MGFLLRPRSREGPHLALRGESPGFSRVAAGNLGSLSSYNGDFRDPLVLPQESPVSCKLRGASLDSSPVDPWAEVLIWIEDGTSGILSSAYMDLRVPLEFPQGSQSLSCVETCKSAFLSNCNGSDMFPFELT